MNTLLESIRSWRIWSRNPRFWAGLLTVFTAGMVIWNDFASSRVSSRLLEAGSLAACFVVWSIIFRAESRRAARLSAEKQRIESTGLATLERLNLVLLTSGIGTWSWDVRQNKVLLDEQNLRLFGLNDPTQLTTVEDFLRFVHPEDRTKVQHDITQALASGDRYKSEFRVVFPDGSLRTLGAAGKVFRDAEGRPLSVYGLDWDLTPRKKAEEEIRNAQERVQKLEGLLPMCSYCKKIRDEKNSWQNVDVYISQRLEAKVSHGICPGCYAEVLEPELKRMQIDART